MEQRRAVGNQQRAAEPGADATALLTLLARALDLDRAIAIAAGPDGVSRAVAAVGTAPDVDAAAHAKWSAVVSLADGGSLCVHRRATTPLTATDRALLERTATSLGRLLGAEHVAAELDRTRDLLAHADRLSALGTLSASVAHEIRNPLVSVRTFIQLLPERLADEEFRTGFRDLALGEIERICGLINDLLAFSRPAPAEREATDLNDLTAQITRLVDAEARRRDVTVSCYADPTLPLVVVDHAQVKQVLMNVILNAIQACAQHGTVDVRTRTEETGGQRWCAIVVADSGAGIPPEHLEHIFEPFFSTKDAGSGLGLFIARQIVVAHGGQIRAGRRPTGGSEFTIHFPLEPRLADADAV
ncbi:MAG TPA: ATP-binding protein [Candidatus Binatia bacterium]|nr:ATP-binding protein [Candidatus Binatia bacterium]